MATFLHQRYCILSQYAIYILECFHKPHGIGELKHDPIEKPTNLCPINKMAIKVGV
jgi:hypothetical protein